MVDQAKKSLRILVTPLNGHGHINACHGLCEELRDRGHEIIFVLDKSFAGKLARYGFKEYLLIPTEKSGSYDDNQEFWPQFFKRNAKRLEESPVEQLEGVMLEAFSDMFAHLIKYTAQYEQAMAQTKPDLIITDGLICLPVVVNAPVPFIWMYSTSVQSMLLDPRIPPFFSGLPLHGDRSEWTAFTERAFRGLEPLRARVSAANIAYGGKALPYGRLHPFSDFLNLYMQPKELRYSELTDLPDNIVGVDCFVRNVSDMTFHIPKQLAGKPGKLIFFSLGSHSSAHVEMMQKICTILAKSPNRFIVSKGVVPYDLPGDNLWGQPFLPQTAILPLVDLVISHGGNNTTTETFYFGKKLLILPLFCDQFDNAQRITELGLGSRLNPHTLTECELLSTVDRLLADHQLTKRMKQIGERIRSSNDKQMVADLIEAKMCIHSLSCSV